MFDMDKSSAETIERITTEREEYKHQVKELKARIEQLERVIASQEAYIVYLELDTEEIE